MCKEIREYISEYIDGIASDDVKAKVASHLSDCQECKQLYEELLSLTLMMNAIPQAEVPDGLEAKVAARISKIETGRGQEPTVLNPRKKRYKRWASLAAIFVVGIFTITMYNNNNMMTDSDAYKHSQYRKQDVQEISLQKDSADLTDAATENQDNGSSANRSVPTSLQSSAADATASGNGESETNGTAKEPEEQAFAISERRGPEPEPKAGGAGAATFSQPCRGMQKETEKQVYAGANDAEQVLLHMRCLEEALAGSEFQIKSSSKIGSDIWRFEVIIDSETVYYLGQGGKIWKEKTEELSL